MVEDIIKEKTSADHLLYVSLKYTKTCDVILNLIARWQSMIETSFDKLINKGVADGKIPSQPISPKQKIEFMKKYFKKYPAIQETIPLYIFFKRIPSLEKKRQGDFRKNVTLKVTQGSKVVEINLDKLQEYAGVLERFISEVKQLISK
ncbi:MAG: hypothetical protein ACP5D2_00095 [Candidatus Nanoarchaeia archaeon]